MYILPIVARQRLGENITAATNTRTTIEAFLDMSFYVRSVWYQGKYEISSSQNFLFIFCKETLYIVTLRHSSLKKTCQCFSERRSPLSSVRYTFGRCID
jgi:hypothetical protein